jgi:rubrerythrin
MKEGEHANDERLRSQKTLQEILSIATAFEEAARGFYTQLIPRVSKNLRWLVTQLADEELRHRNLFIEMAARTDIEQQLPALIEVPAEDSHFSDFIQVPDLGEAPDDQRVLQYALGREQAAMNQYRAVADSIAPGPIHDLFTFLAHEEAQHKAELERLYYELVHSGGV